MLLAVLSYNLLRLLPSGEVSFLEDSILKPISDTYISIISTCGVLMIFMTSLIAMVGLPEDARAIYSALYILVDTLCTSVKCTCVCDELVAINQRLERVKN